MSLLKSIIKYVVEGLAVSVTAALALKDMPNNSDKLMAIIFIGLTASLIFAILDMYSPVTASMSRRGAGFGIGANTVGWGLEGFDGTVPPQTVAEQEEMAICNGSTTSCSYAPTTSATSKARYVCRVKNGVCSATPACSQATGTCEMKDEVKGLVDVVGRTCITEQVPAHSSCRLGPSTGTETFDSKMSPAPVDFSSDPNSEPEGFEGFARVY